MADEGYYTTPVQTVDIPASNVAGSLYDEIVHDNQEDDSLLSTVQSYEPANSGVDRGALDTTAMVLALARLQDGDDPERTLLTGGGLEEARHLLRSHQDQDIRNQIATERASRRLQSLSNLQFDPVLSASERAGAEAAYANVLAYDREAEARKAAEEAALDKIEEMAARDPVQAKVLMDNLELGNANQVKRDFQIKMLKLSELAEVYEAERQEEGWGSWLINFALGMVPTNYNFSRTGVVDANDNGMFDFLTPGTALSEQGEALMNLPMEEFLEAVREGGSFDQAVRANADDFLFGKYDPTAATDILAGLTVQTESDRWWANTWGAVEIASAIPVTRMTNATRTLISAGARKEAVDAVRETADAIVNEGTDAAKAKWGLTEKEVVDGQSISAVNPDVGNPNFVPLGLDVAARDEAARKVIADVPTIVQLNRMTSPEELQAAVDDALKEAEKKYGREIKDFGPVKTEILADGSKINYIEPVFGKKTGGGFASRNSAYNAARTMGLPGSEIEHVIETKMRIEGGIPDGYNLKVYHGTNEVFDEGMASSGGKLGPGYYVTPDANAAADYSGIVTGVEGAPNIRPYFINPSKIFGMNNIEGYTLDDMRRVFDELDITDDEFLAEAGSAIQKRMTKGGPDRLDSQTFIKHLHQVFGRKDVNAGFSIGAGLNRKLDELGYEGIAGNMWGDAEIAIFNPKNAYSQFSPIRTVQDISGQFFVKTRINLTETGFYTNPLTAENQSWWARAVGTAPRISDATMHGKAVQAGSTVNRMQRIVDNVLMKPLRNLSPASKEVVQQIAAAGTNAQRWWTHEEFNLMSVRGFGRPATDKEWNAYQAFQQISDVDYVLRNDLVYKELAIQGMENLSFRAPWGQEFDVLGRVGVPSQKPSDRIFDVSNGIHYNSKNPMTDARFEMMKNEGYVRVDVKGTIKLPDGTEVKSIMVKRSDANFRGLDKQQLAYAEGGHRLYEADYRYFVKQTAFHVQPDTGTKVFKNPNTFVAAKTANEAREWADTMNKALRLFRENKNVSASQLDEAVFMSQKGFPSGEEFLRQIRDGHINSRYDFESMFDRELPSAYTKESASALSYLDPEDFGAIDYLGTTGRKFYSGKGAALKDTRGDLAITVDPFEALNSSLRQITRQSGLSNYKIEMFDRFMNTYGDYLEAGAYRTSVDIFNNAPIKSSTPLKIKQQIESQRSATRNVLGFETPWERRYQEQTRKLAEQLLGDGTNAGRKIAHDAVWWWKTNNPLSRMRGLAFDAKLGMFNLGQLLVQTSTMVSALAMSPKHGFQGMMGIFPLHGYLLAKGSETYLDKIAKTGTAKAMGFATEGEFKDYARRMYASGFLDMNGSHVVVGEYGPSAAFGSFGEKVHQVREGARVFFYTAETYNRMVAFRIAWGEALAKGMKTVDDDFDAEVMRLADDYSFNMTQESASWWQQGLLSIPTQFWAYNVRMMDAMFGGRFTKAQRMRLAAAQVLLAGSAGIPIVDAIADYANKQTGQAPDLDTIAGVLDRGIVDKIWNEIGGGDIRFSEKYGTGSWLTNTVKDIFGAGEYGEKPFDEFVGGASWSIAKSAGGALWNTVKYAHAEGGGGTMTKDSLLKMAMEVSTISNAHKAMMVSNYGILKTRSGTTIASDVPEQDAMWIALGFPSGKQEELSLMSSYIEDNKEDIKKAATIVRNWRQEAFTVPDKYEENMGKVNAFMQLQRPQDRIEILRQTNSITDASLYDKISRDYDELTLKESVLNNGTTD